MEGCILEKRFNKKTVVFGILHQENTKVAPLGLISQQPARLSDFVLG